MKLNDCNKQNNLRILGTVSNEFKTILTPDALRFLEFLHHNFEERRQRVLRERELRQIAIDAGQLPDFLPETAYIRSGSWKVAPIPKDLEDRRVEITGPVDRKMVINALNSGARCYMADFEDSTSPTWFNAIDGQINLRDAVRKQISYVHPKTGKVYEVQEKPATLLVRPRGWHLDEAHIVVNGQVMSGSLVDFGLFFFHNAHQLTLRGSGPYFYLPKLESHIEARLWNDVFVASQGYLNVPQGTIRATVLIETIMAVFEMDEILYELREHSSGLNCGRWDYIFSYIKKLRKHPQFVLPERATVGMTAPFMDSYVKLLIQTCHRRGAHAMGGMAAQIPVKDNPKLNEQFMSAVKEDKKREVMAGHDGTWVAHPALVKIAKSVFDTAMPSPNQISNIPNLGSTVITAQELLQPIKGSITMNGLVENIDVSLMYMEAWLRGNGCIPLHNKMEDAATAEISRSQVWQWIQHGSNVNDGTKITADLVTKILQQQVDKHSSVGKSHRFPLAGQILGEMLTGSKFIDFLTLPCYPHITSLGGIPRL